MEKYPALRLSVRYGNTASVVVAGLVFAMTIGSARNKRSLGTFVRALGLAALLGFGVKNLAELDEIIADTLLPR